MGPVHGGAWVPLAQGGHKPQRTKARKSAELGEALYTVWYNSFLLLAGEQGG